jgi:small GTP-binding protein
MSKNSKEEDFIEIKTILVGSSGVGKTNLINVTVGQGFNESSKPTNCCNLLQKNLEINNIKYVINLWDTIGQEAYKGISKLFFREAQIVIFVYDITSKDSFLNLEEWIQMANDIIDGEYISGIVGNKNDLYLHSQVSEAEAREYAINKNMKFRLVSAKEDPKSFEEFLIELVKEFKIPEQQMKMILNNNPVSKTNKCC